MQNTCEVIFFANAVIFIVILDFTFAGSQSFTESDFREYYQEFVKCLPMDNPTFLANLHSQGLLPDDMKNKIDSMETETAKASYFLDHVIKPRLATSDENLFEKLTTLIECSECEAPKNTNENLRRTPEVVNGNYALCIRYIIYGQIQISMCVHFLKGIYSTYQHCDSD